MAEHAQGKANLAPLHRHHQQLPHRPGSGAARHHAPDRCLGRPWLKPLDAASISLCHVHRSVAFRPHLYSTRECNANQTPQLSSSTTSPAAHVPERTRSNCERCDGVALADRRNSLWGLENGSYDFEGLESAGSVSADISFDSSLATESLRDVRKTGGIGVLG
jgi:hypothetical protein